MKMPDVNATQIITALLTGGSITTFFQIYKSRRTEPIDRQKAAIAASESNVALANEMRDLMKADRDEKEARLKAVELEVQSLKRLFDVSIYHLRALWRWIEDNNYVGAPKLPQELFSLVDMPDERHDHGRNSHPDTDTHSV